MALNINDTQKIPEDQLKVIPELHKHRTNITLILQHSNATPIRSHNGVSYACCVCIDQYPDPDDLKTHTLVKHDVKTRIKFMTNMGMRSFLVKLDITSLHCTICWDPMNSLEDLIEHLIKIHNKTLYTDIKSHILPFKFDDDTLRCVICSGVFNKFKVLLEHMNTHYRNYVCEVCDAGFASQKILNDHFVAHKLGVFKCDSCEKVFDTLRKKKSHEKSVHVHLNFLDKCGYCSKKFQSYRMKEVHIAKIHGVHAPSRKVECNACEKTFANSASLRIHTKRNHLLERRHKCEHCQNSYFSSEDLKRHMLKHSGIKNFQCDVCQKSYGRKHTLREHMRIHADDRRFKCDRCEQTFVQKCSWKSHMRSKHGEVL